MSITMPDSNPSRGAHLERKWDSSAVSLLPSEELASRERWERALSEDWGRAGYARTYGEKAAAIIDKLRALGRRIIEHGHGHGHSQTKADMVQMCKLSTDLSFALRSDRPNIFYARER